MNSGIHLGYAWLLGNTADFTLNERRAVTIAGIAADFDGVAIIFGAEAFRKYHHVMAHNLVFAGVVTLAALIFFGRRLKVVLFCALAALMHLGLDFVASHWDMELLRPFSSAAVNLTHHLPQWLVMYVFQGTGTVLMFALVLWVYLKKERTFLEVFTSRGDRLVMKFLTLPWRHRCGECPRRAFYQCRNCGAFLCMRHKRPAKGWRLLCGKCLASETGGKEGSQ